MKHDLIEAGVIVNTHGLNGEIKIHPWADSPTFLADFDRFFIDDLPVKVLSVRVQKNSVIVSLEGISTVESAIKLKNKTISVSRNDFQPEDGRYLVVDLIGLTVFDAENDEKLGEIAEVLNLPANDVYVVRGIREILVPAVPDFIEEVNISSGYVKIHMIEGL
jgi:16S rRNA processing protein RimM